MFRNVGYISLFDRTMVLLVVSTSYHKVGEAIRHINIHHGPPKLEGISFEILT